MVEVSFTVSLACYNKRLKFGDGRGAAPFQSAVVYLGKDLDRFNDVFGKYGTLYVPHRNLSHRYADKPIKTFIMNISTKILCN